MQEFMQFVMNHWMLWSLFILILLTLLALEFRTQIGGVLKLSPQAAVNLINHDNAIVLDMRNKEDYDNGHVVGAIHANTKDLAQDNRKLQKYKSKPVIIICANGQSSLKAGQALHKQGFEKVHHLHGGITAWRNANLPLKASK